MTPYGRKFVQQKAQEQAKNNPAPEESPDQSPGDRKANLKAKMLAAGKKDVGFAGVVKAVIPTQQKPTPLPSLRPQRHIPYVVIRPGALVQDEPKKGSRKVSKLSNNSKVVSFFVDDSIINSVFILCVLCFPDHSGVCEYKARG